MQTKTETEPTRPRFFNSKANHIATTTTQTTQTTQTNTSTAHKRIGDRVHNSSKRESNPRSNSKKRETAQTEIRRNEKPNCIVESKPTLDRQETTAKQPSKYDKAFEASRSNPKNRFVNSAIPKESTEAQQSQQMKNDSDPRIERFLLNLRLKKEHEIGLEINDKFAESELEDLLRHAKKLAYFNKEKVIKVIESLISKDFFCIDNVDYSDEREHLIASDKTNTNSELQKNEDYENLLKKLDNWEEDADLLNHDDKIKEQDDLIELLQKDTRTKAEDARLKGAYEKLKELEAQRTEYMRFLAKLTEEAKTRGDMGENPEQIVKEVSARWSIERQRLISAFPIYAKKSEIMKQVETNQFLILIGETGSGKSTQIVQYMLETPFIQKQNKLIACVQPRKLAVQTVSKRVAEELKSPIGDLVGFQTGLKNVSGKNTKILFTIDRIFLDELLVDRALSKYSCVIIDEAHERNINTDILLSLIKETAARNPNIRFIVTSATLNEELFVNYFNCSSLRVSGRNYPVEIIYKPMKNYYSYLDAIEVLLKEILQQRSAISTGDDDANWEEEKSKDEKEDQASEGHILVFLAGVDEIEYLLNRVKLEKYDPEKFCFLPLHGRLTPYEQQRVFSQSRSGKKLTKVIFSTRIAETAVTINNVSVVIDIQYDREYVYDEIKKLTVMVTKSITQAQANQRAGRAGRTMPGKCYRIYSEEDFAEMEVFKTPELKRINLDHAVLKVKQFIDDILNFDFIENPKRETLKLAIENLRLLGALDDKERITQLGNQMGMLPTDPPVSRAILEAVLRGCEIDVCKIISVMSFAGDLFHRGRDSEQWEYSDRRKFDFCHPTGDLMTYLNIFRIWESMRSHTQRRKAWCYHNTINPKALTQAEELFDELKLVLIQIKAMGTNPKHKFLTSEIIEKKTNNSRAKDAVKSQAEELIALVETSDNFPQEIQNVYGAYDDIELYYPTAVKENSDESTFESTTDCINEQSVASTTSELENPNRILQTVPEFDKIIYPEHLEIDEKTANILQCCLCAFFPNLALFSGFHELGYTFLRENKVIRIHGASSLNLQGIYPRWIICGEIQLVNDYFCTKVASYVDINWIKHLIPKGFLEKFNILSLEDYPLYVDIPYQKLSSSIIECIKKERGNLIKTLKETTNTYIQIKERDDEVVFWTETKEVEKVKALSEKIIDQYAEASFFDTVERCVTSTGKIRVILGSGAEVQQILLEDEFRALEFFDYPSDSREKIKENMEMFGMVERVDIRKVKGSGRSDGEIVFKTKESAKEAFEQLQSRVVDMRILPLTAKGRTPSTSIKVTFKWLVGKSKCEGIVGFFDREECWCAMAKMKRENERKKAMLEKQKRRAQESKQKEKKKLVEQLDSDMNESEADCVIPEEKEIISSDESLSEEEDDDKLESDEDPSDYADPFTTELDGKSLECGFTNKSTRVMKVKNLSAITDATALKKFFEGLFPNFWIEFAVVFREDNFADTEDAINGLEERKFKAKLREFVQDEGKIRLYPPSTSDDEKVKYKRAGEVIVNNEELAQQLVEAFDGKANIFSQSRVYVEISRDRTWRLDHRTFGIIQKDIEKKITEILEKLDGAVRIHIFGVNGDSSIYKGKTHKYKTPTLRVQSEDKFSMSYAMTELQKVLTGTSYYLKNRSQFYLLKGREGRKFCQQLEKDYNVIIQLLSYQDFLKIIGDSKDVAKVQETLDNFIKTETTKSKVISFRGYNVRDLIRNEAMGLRNIMMYYPYVEYDLRLCEKKIFLSGRAEEVNLAEDHLMKCLTQKLSADEEDMSQECPICYEVISNGYRLVNCRHKICIKCLEGYFRYCASHPENLPICCPACDERVLVCLLDIRNIAPENILAKLWENSYKAYLEKNSQRYRTCPRPGCENIYRINDNEEEGVMDCSVCKKKYFKICQKSLEDGCECWKSRMTLQKAQMKSKLKLGSRYYVGGSVGISREELPDLF